jgi:hypothetical protein
VVKSRRFILFYGLKSLHSQPKLIQPSMKKLFNILFAITLVFQVNAQEAPESTTKSVAVSSAIEADEQPEVKKSCCKKSDEAKSTCKDSDEAKKSCCKKSDEEKSSCKDSDEAKKSCCKKSDEEKSSCKDSDEAKKSCSKNGGDKASCDKSKCKQGTEKAHVCTSDCATSGDCPHKK